MNVTDTTTPGARGAPTSTDGFDAVYQRGLQEVIIPDVRPIDHLRDALAREAARLLKTDCRETSEFLNHFHTRLQRPEDLNGHRLALIQFLNAGPEFRRGIYAAFRPIIDRLIGPDVAIQKRINLTIQIPHFEPDILHVHTDVEGGDSAFEITLWIPLVDVYGTKTMYVLDRTVAESVVEAMSTYQARDLQDLAARLVQPSHYVHLRYGEALLFNPFLLHGNSANVTDETRWSLNVRVKSLFAPYGPKSFAEYFEPVHVSPLTRLGLEHYRRHRL